MFAAVAADNVEGALTHIHVDVEFLPLGAKLVDGRAYRGHEGVRDWRRQGLATWAMTIEAQEFEEFAERLLVHGHIRTRGTRSGVELDTPVSWVFEFREGLVSRVEAFLDADEARRAAGSPD